jgi:hypothetical protein
MKYTYIVRTKIDIYYFSSQALTAHAMSHVGIATIYSHIMSITKVKNFHQAVIGYLFSLKTLFHKNSKRETYFIHLSLDL